jgi:hypothetical protein
VRLRVLLDLLVALAAKPAFHALRTQQRLGYLVRLKGHALPGRLLQQPAGAKHKWDSRHSSGGGQGPAAGHHGSSSCGIGEQEEEEQGAGRVLGLLVGVQSPHTGCQTVQDRVRAWLESYQEHVQQLTQEEFARQLQVGQAGSASSTMHPYADSWCPAVCRCSSPSTGSRPSASVLQLHGRGAPFTPGASRGSKQLSSLTGTSGWLGQPAAATCHWSSSKAGMHMFCARLR